MTKRPLTTKIRRLTARLRHILIVRRVLFCLVFAVAAIGSMLLIDRVTAAELPTWTATPWIVGAATLIGLIWAILGRPSMMEAATAADDRLRLRERLSTALFYVDAEERMQQAVVEDAEKRVRGIRIGEAFPYPFFRELKWLAAIVAIAAGVHLFLPPMDLFGRAEDPNKAIKPLSARQSERIKRELAQLKEDLQARTELKDPLDLKKIAADIDELQRLEMNKVDERKTLAKLSKLSDKVAEREEEMSEKMKDFEKLAPPKSKFTEDLAKDMQAGRFEEAQKKIEELKDKLEKGEMSEQDKQQLTEEMEKLAEQLKNNPNLSEALRKAAESIKSGMTGQSLKAMESAQKELGELAESLAQMEQLDQLKEQLESMKGQAGKGSQSGDSGEGSGDGGGKGSVLPESSDGQGDGSGGEWGRSGDPFGKFEKGDLRGKGRGGGQAGTGMGGVANVGQDAVKFNPDQGKMQQLDGEILAAIKVEGDQIRGEARVQFEEKVMEYRQAAEDTLERERMPLEYREMVTDYFDAIRPDANKKASKSSDNVARPVEDNSE